MIPREGVTSSVEDARGVDAVSHQRPPGAVDGQVDAPHGP
jgi:hypothetical protein